MGIRGIAGGAWGALHVWRCPAPSLVGGGGLLIIALYGLRLLSELKFRRCPSFTLYYGRGPFLSSSRLLTVPASRLRPEQTLPWLESGSHNAACCGWEAHLTVPAFFLMGKRRLAFWDEQESCPLSSPYWGGWGGERLKGPSLRCCCGLASWK